MTELLKELDAVVGKMERIKASGWSVDTAELKHTRAAIIDFVHDHHAEIAEAVRDAVRYMWLREHLDGDEIGGFDITVTRMKDLTEWIWDRDDLDVVIDSAIQSHLQGDGDEA